MSTGPEVQMLTWPAGTWLPVSGKHITTGWYTKLQMTMMLTFADLIDQQEVITANDFGYPHRPLLALDQ